MLKIIAIAIPVLLIIPISVVVLIFGKLDMASFVFHLIFSMDGTPWSDLAGYFLTVGVLWGIFCLSVYRSRSWLNKFWPSWGVIGIGILTMNPLFYDLIFNRVVAVYGKEHSMIAEFLRPEFGEIKDKKNLIIIYLEGYERSYFDKDVFGNITGPLMELEKQAISFTDIHQVTGTGWSLAGTVATQCGAPILPFGARPLNGSSEVRLILPSVVCLGDILKQNGYHQTYMTPSKSFGHKMGYYGFDNFITTHGYDTLLDRESIATERTEIHKDKDKDFDGWGLYDQDLYAAALEHIIEKDKAGQPFMVTLATMATHFPAVVDPVCDPSGEGSISQDMRDSVKCGAEMVAGFVEDLKRSVDFNNYRIVIMSDHLAHRNNLFDQLDQMERRNFVMLLAADTLPQKISKSSSMMDVFPTILEWVGVGLKENGAGLGRSLFSSTETLIEKFELSNVNSALKQDVDLAKMMWE